MITRTGIADEIDGLDLQIKALNEMKSDAYKAYREQLEGVGMEPRRAAAEVAATKAAIAKRRKLRENPHAAREKDDLIDAILCEIMVSPSRAREAHDPETGEIQESGADKEVRFPVSFSGEAGNRVSVLSSPAGSGSDEIPATYHEMDRHAVTAGETALSEVAQVEAAGQGSAPVQVSNPVLATNSNDFDPSKITFLAPKTMADYRPHCQRPDACGSSGLRHCYSCMKSAGLAEASAS